MAEYLYRCEKCEAMFVLTTPMGQAPKEYQCPQCGEPNAKRAFSMPSIVFGGGGCGPNAGGGCCG